MKKLTLDLDSLRVESFDIEAPAREHGTVHAHAITEFGDSCDFCGGGSQKGSCVTCDVPTDPCICDPFEPLTEFEDCA